MIYYIKAQSYRFLSHIFSGKVKQKFKAKYKKYIKFNLSTISSELKNQKVEFNIIKSEFETQKAEFNIIKSELETQKIELASKNLNPNVPKETEASCEDKLLPAYDLTKLKRPNKDTCIIVVNGPSLKIALSDINTKKFIASHPISCVNAFVGHEVFTELKPKYLSIMDPVYWFNPPIERNLSLLETMKQGFKKVTWNLTVFIPDAAKEFHHFKEIAENNPNISFQYITTNYTHRNPISESFSYYENNHEMPAPQSVVIASIFTAINMGYKNVYLFGADHTWHRDLYLVNNKLHMVDSHFYDTSKPLYRPLYKDSSEEVRSISEIFYLYYVLHRSHEELAAYAKYKNVNIYNASSDSFIDAYERIDLLNMNQQ